MTFFVARSGVGSRIKTRVANWATLKVRRAKAYLAKSVNPNGADLVGFQPATAISGMNGRSIPQVRIAYTVGTTEKNGISGNDKAATITEPAADKEIDLSFNKFRKPLRKLNKGVAASKFVMMAAFAPTLLFMLSGGLSLLLGKITGMGIFESLGPKALAMAVPSGGLSALVLLWGIYMMYSTAKTFNKAILKLGTKEELEALLTRCVKEKIPEDFRTTDPEATKMLEILAKQ